MKNEYLNKKMRRERIKLLKSKIETFRKECKICECWECGHCGEPKYDMENELSYLQRLDKEAS